MKLIAALALLLAVPAPPDDPEWGQWRGPNRDGISPDTGLLKSWPAEGPPLAWKAPGLGSGYSTVSVLGDRLYTMGDLDACYLIALNRADGKIAWKTKVSDKTGANDDKRPGPRCTPPTDGTHVYALGPYGELVCVLAKDGSEKWRKNLANDFGGKIGRWDYSESPLLDGENLICTPGGSQGTVLALEKATGKTVWRSTDLKDRAEYTSLAPVEIGGVRQYLVFTMASVAGIAAKDGNVLWRAAREGQTAICTTPVYKDGYLFVTSGYNVGCNAFKVTGQGGKYSVEAAYGDKKEEKGARKMANHHGGVTLVGDHLYGISDGSGLKCIELKTGTVAWEARNIAKGSLAYADGHLVARAEGGAGTITLVEATPSGYKEKGRFNPPDRSRAMAWPYPVIYGGRMYIRDQDVLLCFDVKAK